MLAVLVAVFAGSVAYSLPRIGSDGDRPSRLQRSEHTVGQKRGDSGSDTPWPAVLSALAAAVTAAGVVLGGGWALFRYRRLNPDWTRALPGVRGQLMTSGDRDFIEVRISVTALGTARLLLCKEDSTNDDGGDVDYDGTSSVSVYRCTEETLGEGAAINWDGALLNRIPVFQDEAVVEAGERLDEAHLVPVGERSAGTLAYRLVFRVSVHDQVLDSDYTWRATDYLPVELVPVQTVTGHPEGQAGDPNPEGDAGAER